MTSGSRLRGWPNGTGRSAVDRARWSGIGTVPHRSMPGRTATYVVVVVDQDMRRVPRRSVPSVRSPAFPLVERPPRGRRVWRRIVRNSPWGRAYRTVMLARELWSLFYPGDGEWEIPGYVRCYKCNSWEINWQFPKGVCGVCYTLQAGGHPLGTVYHRDTNPQITLAHKSGIRWSTVETWQRVGAWNDPAYGNQAIPQRKRIWVPETAPYVPLDPMAVMPQQFAQPVPVPWRARNLARAMREQREREMFPQPRPQPARAGRAYLFGYEVAAEEVVARITELPDHRVKVQAERNPNGIHLLVRPAEHEREVKFKSRTWTALHRLLAHWGLSPTEWVEFIDALYAELPGRIRGNPAYHGTIPNRVRAILDHYTLIDWEAAMENVAVNWLEDMAIGRLNRYVNQVGERTFGRDFHYWRGALGHSRNNLERLTEREPGVTVFRGGDETSSGWTRSAAGPWVFRG